MFLLGVVSFNLFHLNDRLQMLQVINAFHRGLRSNDKKLIDSSLSDNFVETGVKIAVGTPDAIYKNTVLNLDYSNLNLSIESKYLIPLNILSNSNTSLSFIRKVTLITESGNPLSVFFYVTYTFEKTADGIKIIKIERKL
jgi:hypothetical protein